MGVYIIDERVCVVATIRSSCVLRKPTSKPEFGLNADYVTIEVILSIYKSNAHSVHA